MTVDKKNIILRNTEETVPYSSGAKRVEKNFPNRNNIAAHGAFINRRLQECYERTDAQKQAAAIKYKEGIYLEFSSAQGHDLATKSLESKQQGIRLLNIKQDETSGITKAVVYIPDGKQTYFLSKINAYVSETTKTGKPKNNDLVSGIEDVKIALVESFWFGKHSDIPNETPLWCEIWLRCTEDDAASIYNSFIECCEELGIECNEKKILFPERMVVLAKVNNKHLSDLISTFEYIAELRRAPEPTGFFENLSGSEQQEVIDEILSRTTFLDTNTSVCILDTGINSAHPLLSSAIKNDQSIQSVDGTWGTNDHQGHGTEMAGIALYNNLKDVFLSTEDIDIGHKIESVKILPPKGSNQRELYGAITEQAVALAEIENPDFNRTICMAVTSDEFYEKDGSPTSWSASVDSITSGANTDGEDKRLFFISAGNVYPHAFEEQKYPDANITTSVHEPGQAWNAITVGAYSKDIVIQDEQLKGYSPVADVEELSPYSSTSKTWTSKWPIKPEILMDGGNIATDGEYYTEADDLSLLTTSKDILTKPLTTTWGTSSATAQASLMSAQIYSIYPEIWPETVRALLIHSARWTEKMKKQFCSVNTKTVGRNLLLRTCGYGIPNLQRAIQCYNNSVNLIIESELQPFEGKNMNEMHIHKLPWPKEVLESLGETQATLRVTLSYFIEPGPGEIGWKDKYRYASCGLRFDVINSNETIQDFQKRVNVKMRGDDRQDSGDGNSRDWFLGVNNRDVGSIHSDFCESTAVDFADANYIAVYPVVGWWRERSYLGKSQRKIRYSLIVSIETPEIETDIYTPIITQIQNQVVIENTIDI